MLEESCVAPLTQLSRNYTIKPKKLSESGQYSRKSNPKIMDYVKANKMDVSALVQRYATKLSHMVSENFRSQIILWEDPVKPDLKVHQLQSCAT